MGRQLAFLVLCSGFVLLISGCATKSFVETQLSTTETKLTQRADTQEAKLRETADRAGASRQAIDEMGALASDAKTRAASALDAEARLAQRLADRNKFRLLETRSIYFDSGKTEIRSGDMSELEDVAKALKADANAILELQGFADPRGNDRQNNELARERVEAVTRYLVQRYDIELRQLRGFAMGKVAVEKSTPEAFARHGGWTFDCSPLGRPGKTPRARSTAPRLRRRRQSFRRLRPGLRRPNAPRMMSSIAESSCLVHL